MSQTHFLLAFQLTPLSRTGHEVDEKLDKAEEGWRLDDSVNKDGSTCT